MIRALTVAALVVLCSARAWADPLEGLEIRPEVDAPFDRDLMYGGWRDEDGDCQDNRAEVLAEQSLVPVTYAADGCTVREGLWYDPYTEFTVTDPTSGRMQIDHVVPLEEAHQSGAYAWSDEKRRAYANDRDNPGHLIAVLGETDDFKGCRDPAEWMPPNRDFYCAYVGAWVAIKLKWGLSVDQREADAITEILTQCHNSTPRPNSGSNSECLAPGAVPPS